MRIGPTETSGTTRPTTWRHIPQDSNFSPFKNIHYLKRELLQNEGGYFYLEIKISGFPYTDNPYFNRAQ